MTSEKMRVHTTYEIGFSCDVGLPEGYTRDDIDEFSVKYGVLHVTFNDGTSFIEELEEHFDEITDQMKNPIYCDVFELDSNGEIVEIGSGPNL